MMQNLRVKQGVGVLMKIAPCILQVKMTNFANVSTAIKGLSESEGDDCVLSLILFDKTLPKGQ